MKLVSPVQIKKHTNTSVSEQTRIIINLQLIWRMGSQSAYLRDGKGDGMETSSRDFVLSAAHPRQKCTGNTQAGEDEAVCGPRKTVALQVVKSSRRVMPKARNSKTAAAEKARP